VNCRANFATMAVSLSCSTRAIAAASAGASMAGGCTSNQASCWGDGSRVTAQPAPAAPVGICPRQRWGAVLAGFVRRSLSQRRICLAVPVNPCSRISRHSAAASSQPSACRAWRYARCGSMMLWPGRPVARSGNSSARAY
jgi:hypothetical protein